MAGNGGRVEINQAVRGVEESLVSDGNPPNFVDPARVDLAVDADSRLKSMRGAWIQARLSSKKVDLIVEPKANQLRGRFWLGIPIVTSGVDRQFYEANKIEYAPFEHIYNDPLPQNLRERYPNLEFIDLTTLSFDWQLAEVGQIPPDTVVIIGAPFLDVRANMTLPGPVGFGVQIASASAFGTAGLAGHFVDLNRVGREVGSVASSLTEGKTQADACKASVEFKLLPIWKDHLDAMAVAALALVVQFLLVAFLLSERSRRKISNEALAERLHFEKLLSEVSSTLANRNNRGIDDAIKSCLKKLSAFVGDGVASIWRWDTKSPVLSRTHTWSEVVPAGVSLELSAADFSDTIRRLANGEDVRFPGESGMPQLADCESFRKAGITQFLATPLYSNHQFIGALSISGNRNQGDWPAALPSRIRIIAEILGSALARELATDALQENELLTGSILDSLRSSIAVINNEGIIVEVNKHWMERAAEITSAQLFAGPVGANYLRGWENNGRTAEAAETLQGILSVLSGAQPFFERDYSYAADSSVKWFRMAVTRMSHRIGGALVSYMDISSQKMAEIERGRMRDDLAQLNRSREMGHLAASLAHELAQPLAALLSNAQAAARLAASSEPNIPEIQEALADIIEADKRASAVLDNVRAILKKHTIKPHAVNLNLIVQDVALLVRNDAFLNGVKFQVILWPDAVLVQGDEVPLQQVLLNLVNNAMAAMRQVPRERRILSVKTQVKNGLGLLFVEDEGPGIPESLKPKLFLPFFTTKNESLGMGLSICATILESLGGTISFANRGEQGAVFSVGLRLSHIP
jgi:signal transduction histidine kinase